MLIYIYGLMICVCSIFVRTAPGHENTCLIDATYQWRITMNKYRTSRDDYQRPLE
jgi:hypothetical protein